MTYECTFTTGASGQIKFSAYNPTVKIRGTDTFFNNIICPVNNMVVISDNLSTEYTLYTAGILADGSTTTLDLNINLQSDGC